MMNTYQTFKGGITGTDLPSLTDKVTEQINTDRVYPCNECGTMRTKEEGGTTFTVCDECWEKNKWPGQ
mgnify:FL=1